MQGNNFDQALKERGLSTPNAVKRLWDINPGFGGPIKRDRLWFYGTIRQLELKVGIAYGANLDEVLVVAKEIVEASVSVLKEPAPLIGISELTDSSVTLSIQPWVAIADMITARAELYQAIIERFRARKIDIPFPQREVRMLSGS